MANKTLSSVEARKNFSSVLDDVGIRGEHVTVSRNGRPLAVLVHPDDYAAYERMLDARDNKAADAALVEPGENISIEDLAGELNVDLPR